MSRWLRTQLDVASRSLASMGERAAVARRFDAGVSAAPAAAAKRRHLLRLFREHRHEVFVESGTHLGDTVAFFVPHARRIFSVEIEPGLYAAAAERFADAPHVTLIQGNAVEWVPRIVDQLREGALVWLDGHYSGPGTGRGETNEPVAQILRRMGQLDFAVPLTIVVDDLRLFGVDPEFPTLADLFAAAKAACPTGQMYIDLDALVIANRKARD